MGISERKTRERAERERRIVVAARTIAERDGWASVTIRRLAEEIEYSQPVLYSHFENRDQIVGAVALEGFGELAVMLRAAIRPSSTPKERVEGVAAAYLDFAFARPAMYEAMFVLPTGLRFARSDTPAQLRDGFGAMATVIAPFSQDVDTATETFWAALHGLAELERHGRIRPAFRAHRITLIVQMVSGNSESGSCD
ncbi:TetR/AcrR family transcriptional regulator [Rhizobium jaguaris]|uniref:TetR/AcrR family transcriptional regulator n=1 Tax=Rhizobium jaguaris TaxID=1312183 RepID=A0A387FXY8_9HYPH|nr:TetR/AcrR family transcriptional regulator [Rhizobium jaguaris]AYG63549.1 TetR/AcrR family transcriptional regulator [Rhizobium jaguaris]